MIREAFNPPDMNFPGMSQAVRCGDWLTISGQVALADGQVVGLNDPLAQARQCFANLQKVLLSAGSGFPEVVILRGYLTRRQSYESYAQVKAECFGHLAPAGTVVVVADLLLEGLLMEIEAVAWLGRSS